MSQTIRYEVDERGVATLTLNRPEVRNAFDDRLIARLAELLDEIAADETIRCLILTGAGTVFSAGADIGWMRAMAACGEEENYADALRLAALMGKLDRLPKPTVARVNGAAVGGGVGLLACCDIVVASSEARFGLTEVRLGLLPAVISPFVIAAIGPRNARRLFLSGEIVSAKQARRVGLVHEICKPEHLDAAVADQVTLLLAGGPEAQHQAKELVTTVVGFQGAQADLAAHTAQLIARLRASAEGQEGLGAFLEKRPPRWVTPGGGG